MRAHNGSRGGGKWAAIESSGLESSGLTQKRRDTIHVLHSKWQRSNTIQVIKTSDSDKMKTEGIKMNNTAKIRAESQVLRRLLYYC